jgi:hypothetical protein
VAAPLKHLRFQHRAPVAQALLPARFYEAASSEGKRAESAFPFGGGDHINSVPGAAFEERAVGAFAGAQFAADAEQGIDDDAAEWSVVLVRRPVHALRNGAVLHTGGGAGASRAAFINDGKYMRFTLPLRRRAVRHGLALDDCSCLKFLDARGRIRHVEPPKYVGY